MYFLRPPFPSLPRYDRRYLVWQITREYHEGRCILVYCKPAGHYTYMYMQQHAHDRRAGLQTGVPHAFSPIGRRSTSGHASCNRSRARACVCARERESEREKYRGGKVWARKRVSDASTTANHGLRGGRLQSENSVSL